MHKSQARLLSERHMHSEQILEVTVNDLKLIFSFEIVTL